MPRRPVLPALAGVLCALGLIAAVAVAVEGDATSAQLDPSSPSMQRAIEAAQQQQAEAEAYRNSSVGIAEREASRNAFDDQPDDQALATARAEFPGLVTTPALRWPQLGPGQEIDRYLSPASAIVEADDGTKAVLQSDLPLRGETPDGERAPLDMSLSDQGERYEPKSTAQPVELPTNSQDEVRFPEQHLGVKVAGADPADAVRSSNKLFFANALTDTDVVAEPTPNGAEVSLVLRSPHSPTDPALRFDLPEGAALRLTDEPDTAEVVKDGRRLALVDPPLAVDAQGRTIAVSYSVDGDRLVMHVADTSDAAWPVMVDPNTHVYDNNGQSVGSGSPGFTWPGWTWASNRPLGGCPASGSQMFYECKNADGSLRVLGFTSFNYAALDYGAFIKRARSGTYIYSFHAANMSHVMQKSWTMAGICNTDCTVWMKGHWWTPLDKGSNAPKQGVDADRLIGTGYAGQTDYFCYDPTLAAPTTSCPLANLANSSPETNNTARWGMLMLGGTPVAQPSAAIGGAATLSSDNVPPKIVSVTHSNAPVGGWVKDYTDTVTLRAADNNALLAENGYTVGSDLNANGDPLQGIGLGSVAVSGPSAPAPQSAGCTTTNAYDQCPQVKTFPGMTYTAPEGTSTYTPSSTDIVGNSQNGTPWTVKVDRTVPTGSFTNVPTYTNGTANITGTISDSLSGPQDAKVQYQGPGSITWVDACPRQAATSTFSCNWSTAGLADGTYKVRAELRDNTAGTGPNVGYTSTDTGTATVVVDHVAPQQLQDIAPSVGSNDYPGELDESDLTEVSFGQNDATAGVEQTTLDYNSANDGTASGQWVAAEAEPATGEGDTSTFWETTAVSAGLHRVRATTTDKAGNTSQTQFQVVMPKVRPCTRTPACYAGFGYGLSKPSGPPSGSRPPCDDDTAKFADADPTKGDDNHSGTSTSPFRTVRKLADSLTVAKPVGCLKDSSYTYLAQDPDLNVDGGEILNSKGLKRLTIQSVSGHPTWKGHIRVVGANVTLRGLNIDARNLESSDCSYSSVNQKCPLFSPELRGDNDVLIDSEVTSHGSASDVSSHTNCVHVKGQPSNVLIKNNVIHDCGYPIAAEESSGGHWHGIYIATGTGARVIGNLIYDNADRGVQVYPAATGARIAYNTIHHNGMGIVIGGAINKDGCSVCYPENTEITKNIVTDSLAGHDARYTSQDPPPTYNVYSNETSGRHGNLLKANNCLYLTYNGTGGYATGDGGLTFEDKPPTVENPLYLDAAHHDFQSRNPRCSKFGASATAYKAWGLRDRLTTPSFSGTANGVKGTTTAVAARLRSPAHRWVETGVTNKAPCGSSATSDWIVYVKWKTRHGTAKKCAKRIPLPPNASRDFSAVITKGKRDIIDAPGYRGKNRVILDQTKNKYTTKAGLMVDAFARTLKYPGNVGGAWTNVNFLAGAANGDGSGDWRTPSFAETYEMTSTVDGYRHASYNGSSTPWTSFCAYGPNQGGCP